MGAEHTPGPWSVFTTPYAGGATHEITAPHITIAVVNEKRETSHSQMDGPTAPQANARLIAAAPELLAALEEIVFANDEDATRGAMARIAQKAIAKARGTDDS